MINVIELEKQWMKYKIKYYLPHFTIFVSTLIIFVVTFVFIKHDVTDTPVTIKKVIIPLPKEILPAIKAQGGVSEPQLKLQPSLKFLKEMQSSSQAYVETPKIHHPKVIATKQKPKPRAAKAVVPEEKKISRISIKRKDTGQDLKKIIKRFKESNNPGLSLFIAKKYYAQKNYQQAYNYALITNKLNSEIDESWIVFSKSLVKLGKKEFAIRVLQDYTQETKSSTANILLSDIKSGKFR